MGINYVLNSALENLTFKKIGEIYNLDSYGKVTVTGYYGRPIIIVAVTARGSFEIFMWGQDVSNKRIRLGNSPVTGFGFYDPPSSGSSGRLCFKASKNDLSITFYAIGSYNTNISPILEGSTESEYNASSGFTM